MAFPTSQLRPITQGSVLTINTLPNAGQNTMANSLGVAIASDQSAIPLAAGSAAIGSIIGRTTMATATPTVTSNGTYAAGNIVGGLITFAVGGAGSGTLMSLRVTSKSVIPTVLKAYVFWANPTNTTWTNNSAPAINTADIASLLTEIPLNAADNGLGTMTVWSSSGIGAQFVAATLYLILVTVASITLTSSSTSDITVQLGISDD